MRRNSGGFSRGKLPAFEISMFLVWKRVLRSEKMDGAHVILKSASIRVLRIGQERGSFLVLWLPVGGSLRP